jgi:hypothetical protein
MVELTNARLGRPSDISAYPKDQINGNIFRKIDHKQTYGWILLSLKAWLMIGFTPLMEEIDLSVCTPEHIESQKFWRTPIGGLIEEVLPKPEASLETSGTIIATGIFSASRLQERIKGLEFVWTKNLKEHLR